MVVLAHNGGVDEALTFGLPVVIFVAFMWAERRARRREREQAAADATEPAERPADATD